MFLYPDFHIPSLFCFRHVLLFFICTSLPSCHSEGQNNHDESDYFQRRKIPTYVTEALPSATDTLAKTSRFLFLGHGELDTEIVRETIQKCQTLNGTISGFSGNEKTIESIIWHLYPSSEIKGLMLKNSAPIQLEFEKGEAHSVASKTFSNHYTAEAMQLLLRQIYGVPKIPELEKGLAIWCDDSWQAYGYREWSARLAAANGLPPLAELLNSNHWSSCSPLIFGAASASFVDFLIELNGMEKFLAGYTSWTPGEAELIELEKGWKVYQAKLLSQPIKPPIAEKELPYIQGFNFAHEGYRIYNGYGSRKAEQALRHLNNMGSNAVAIVPYSFLRNANEPARIPVVKHPGAENDESVITSSEDAQNNGMAVVLKPQIWMGGGQWPGDIAMNSEEDWDKFFHCYRHWIMHYAMLAEIYEWEVLCTGTEMVKTTLNRQEDWKRLFQDLRKVYNGKLTYAANWGEEFENTTIWDELDFIGINCYYPLSQKDEPSDAELKSAFGVVVDKIERVHRKFDKPIVFTEIGFPNIHAPWKKPHEDWGDFVANEQHQRRCYEIVFQCIKNKPWCKGILWWKYPSDLEHRSRRSTGFSPHGKLAEGTVEKWFIQKGE